MKTRKAVIAAVLASGLVATPALAGSSSQRWDHYRSRSGNVVIIKAACVGGEDSMAHPKLVDYADHGGRIVLGCYRKGY